MEYIIETENLKVGYDSKPVVEDISIKIERGSIITLIGPNGAGKSTLLKTLYGELEPVEGTVYITTNGSRQKLREIRKDELSRHMAVVLTTRPRTEYFTVKEMLEAGRYPYTGYFGVLSEKDHEIVEQTLELTGIKELSGRDFMQLSDGQKQLVMIARAICQQPEILILDEPTTFLDIKYKLEIMKLIERLAKEKGMTVIMSLHELELSRRISDKIICLKDKSVLKYDIADKVFAGSFINELYNVKEDLGWLVR